MGLPGKTLETLDKPVRLALIALIRFYRYFLSPLMGHQCRFYPSCSHYAQTAVERFGAFRGSYLAARRLLRCHPWHEGGIDPVPNKFGKKHG